MLLLLTYCEPISTLRKGAGKFVHVCVRIYAHIFFLSDASNAMAIVWKFNRKLVDFHVYCFQHNAMCFHGAGKTNRQKSVKKTNKKTLMSQLWNGGVFVPLHINHLVNSVLIII